MSLQADRHLQERRNSVPAVAGVTGLWTVSVPLIIKKKTFRSGKYLIQVSRNAVWSCLLHWNFYNFNCNNRWIVLLYSNVKELVKHLWMGRPTEEIYQLKFSWILYVEENSCNYVLQSSKLILTFIVEIHSKNTLAHKSTWNSDHYFISNTPSLKNKYIYRCNK